jgi:hypothetical protein
MQNLKSRQYSATKLMVANRDGICMYCGREFEKGDTFKWHYDQRVGYCPDCPCTNVQGPILLQQRLQKQQQEQAHSQHEKQREDIADQVVKTIEAASYVVPKLAEMFDGSFTVPFTLPGDAPGTKRHITIKISTRRKNSKKPGRRRIRAKVGKRLVDVGYIMDDGKLFFLNLEEDQQFSDTRITVTKKAVETIVMGTQDEQVMYGMYNALISRKCWRCGRLLTNPATLRLTSGCGPVCDSIISSQGIHLDKTNIQVPIKTFTL